MLLGMMCALPLPAVNFLLTTDFRGSSERNPFVYCIVDLSTAIFSLKLFEGCNSVALGFLLSAIFESMSILSAISSSSPCSSVTFRLFSPSMELDSSLRTNDELLLEPCFRYKPEIGSNFSWSCFSDFSIAVA